MKLDTSFTASLRLHAILGPDNVTAWSCALLLFLACGPGTGVLYAEEEIRYDFYLTHEADNEQPGFNATQQFDCSDRIYAVIEAKGLAAGEHELEVRWKEPSGSQRELTRYPFKAQSFTRIWAWLQLHGPTTAIVGQMFDPSFGMEEFIGTWTAEISVDGERLETLQFEVLC